MDLVKCRQCYGLVAPGAKRCMHCHAVWPTGAAGAGWIKFIIVVVLLTAIGTVLLSAPSVRAEYTAFKERAGLWYRWEFGPMIGIDPMRKEDSIFDAERPATGPCRSASPAADLNCRDSRESE